MVRHTRNFVAVTGGAENAVISPPLFSKEKTRPILASYDVFEVIDFHRHQCILVPKLLQSPKEKSPKETAP
jgi:hypothetical protein